MSLKIRIFSTHVTKYVQLGSSYYNQ
ncbi:unnamed protein product [Acanthoscelides obtectus]|uniref:Uncharacterized protein n=1 Tax=Acanthoscelides obtectus TaxID=200917 RepID=A0A9P0Q615_ACAOB|nr:unnamed protein product [Acanthoscelides obtectus]CAK1621498.1 hypothetical protein AOBTE_LOCUS994 [Acanthoscelides obtectus]